MNIIQLRWLLLTLLCFLMAACGANDPGSSEYVVGSAKKMAEPAAGKSNASIMLNYDVDALALRADFDPQAARQFHGLYMLCAGLERRSSSKLNEAKIGWNQFESLCQQSQATFTQRMPLSRQYNSAEWRSLVAIGDMDESDPNRDRELEHLLYTSSDAEVQMNAAMMYTTSERLYEWADGGGRPASLYNDSTMLQIDVALMYGCKVGMDCSPQALATLGECAMTQPCQPGATLQQVVTVRRSPQEMKLIERSVDQLIKISRR